MKFWLMDAFTQNIFGGNPAGVVPEADVLSPRQMQQIASEIHASETAFVLRSTSADADFRIRYFTPTNEIDLCGHATIGTVCALLQNGYFGDQAEGVCRIETRVGILPISYRWQYGVPWAEMGQASPMFRSIDINPQQIADWLGIHESDLALNLPVGLAYTGLWDAFVPLQSVEVMSRLQPNLQALSMWNEALGVASTHVYTTETVLHSSSFHCRDFSPAVGIPEDPATGTATGALLAFLHHNGLVQPNQVYGFEQGYEIERPSLISARLTLQGETPSVFVGGTAVCSISGDIQLSFGV